MFTDKNGIEWRNLMEQVKLNQDDIQNLLTGAATLAEFGLKVINVSETGQPPTDPPVLEPGDANTYGYSWLVRTNPGDTTNPAAYDIYIWTRINFATDAAWINLGEFPKRGPQGFIGPAGENGPPGVNGTNGTRGTITYFQSGFPTSGMITGDQLLMPSYDMYRWSGTQWTYIGNIKGATGNTGATGANGLTPYIQDGFWYIGSTNTNVKAEGVDGSSVTIQTGTYTVASLPNFSSTQTGDAFYVTDDPTYPQGALYFNGAGGTTWTVIPWGAEAGPQGPKGDKGDKGDSIVSTLYVNNVTGDDSNDGLTADTALFTLKAALDKANNQRGDFRINLYYNANVNYYINTVGWYNFPGSVTIDCPNGKPSTPAIVLVSNMSGIGIFSSTTFYVGTGVLLRQNSASYPVFSVLNEGVIEIIVDGSVEMALNPSLRPVCIIQALTQSGATDSDNHAVVTCSINQVYLPNDQTGNSYYSIFGDGIKMGIFGGTYNNNTSGQYLYIGNRGSSMYGDGTSGGIFMGNQSSSSMVTNETRVNDMIQAAIQTTLVAGG